MKFAALAMGQNFVYDFAVGDSGVLSGTPVAATQPWLGSVSFGNNATNSYTFPNRPAVADAEITMAGLLLPSSTTNNNFVGTNSTAANTGYQLAVSTALSVQLKVGTGAAVTSINSAFTVTLNHPLFVACTYDGATATFLARDLYTNTITVGTVSSAATVAASNGTYRFLNNLAGGNLSASYLAAAFYGNIIHSVGDLMAWARDPWAIFEVPQVLFLVGVPAAAFQAAWALNRNFINQGVAT